MKTRRSCERGSVMVEFALLMPLLVALFLGTVFFGQDIHMYNRLEESVRAGARYGSNIKYDAFSGADPAPDKCTSCELPIPPGNNGPFVTAIRNIVAYGCYPAEGSTTGCTEVPVVEGVLPQNVNVTLKIENGVPRYVTVSVHDVRMITPVGQVMLNGKPVTTFNYLGAYAAPLPPK